MNLKGIKLFQQMRKAPLYHRLRQLLPMPEAQIIDDRSLIGHAEVVAIDWPQDAPKPLVGIVRDYEKFPRWSKYCRFLDHNHFPYEFYDIQSHDWLDKAKRYDLIVGVQSNELYLLRELRRKYYTLEKFLGKKCYPSTDHILLYEDKSLEAYISKISGIPFINTYISHDRQDALRLVKNLNYPVVSKIDPSSGSVGVELLHSERAAGRIVEKAFSAGGRKAHRLYDRQKNYVYFQDFQPNDGYDIRVIVIRNWAFGYYRKVLEGDFRASGMNLIEKRELPEEAIRIALSANKVVKSPMLAVDMVHGTDGKYYVIEFSPFCQIEFPEQLHVNGEPGVYLVDDKGGIRFQKGKYWVHELALKQFLLEDYLPFACGGAGMGATQEQILGNF